MKRQLHTLYIKHDAQFKTLSKIALSQLILKIVYFKGDGTLFRQIEAELASVLSSSVSKSDISDAIQALKVTNKLHEKAGRFFIHNDYKNEINQEIESNKVLLSKVLDKYFIKAESDPHDVENWFTDSIICFFEKFSFEWFHQITYKGRNGSNIVPNIKEIIENVLLENKKILEEDKEWLKSQFVRFIDSDDPDDNLLFWYYGISMFSSRLITARNYADTITIDIFKNSKFILDTNVLMILDLEGHELSNSLKLLESILKELNISPVFLYVTRDEYLRAMEWRKNETIAVFNNYKLEVLKTSDCPFIQTALRRGCKNGDDVRRMFDSLLEVPSIFSNDLKIKLIDYQELNEVIEEGVNNEALKTSINEIYKKRRGKDKREKTTEHDAGIISGAMFLRKQEKCWIITMDSTLKRYAIENCHRDDNEVAVGLDVVIALMAVNSGGVKVDSSNFAPLFKNIIRYSLMPEREAFEVRDLAFILRTNIKVNELTNEKVIEAAKEVKRMRIAGENEENVALYLRRFIEGDTVNMIRDAEEARSRVIIAEAKREEAELERDIISDEYRNKRRGELRDFYDENLRKNRFKFFAIPSLIAVIIFLVVKYFLNDSSQNSQIIIAIGIEFIFGLLPLIPLNKKLKRRYSDYITGIDRQIDIEITELRKRAKS